MSKSARTLFVYWGRRGSLSKFMLELAKLKPDGAIFSPSRQNELFDEIRATDARLLPVDTFRQSYQAIVNLPRIIGIRRQIRQAIRENGIERVVVLMPHVWTPFIESAVRETGARYVVVVHDVVGHTGDIHPLVTRWLLQDALKADQVVTLSHHVAKQFSDKFPAKADKVTVLFHPVLTDDDKSKTKKAGGLLFLGRIMAYKGLALFVEACELLRSRGRSFRIGVVGEGDISAVAGRLNALGAEIHNRWLTHDEMSKATRQYDAVVTSYLEASQSGIVALAHGLGLPVLTTPVGGLVEQVDDGRTGLIARDVTAADVADVMQRFLEEPALRVALQAGVDEIRRQRSMPRFLEEIIS